MDSDNKHNMELDILAAAFELGSIFPGTPANQSLVEAYPDEEERLTVFADYLIEERFLFPLFDPTTGGEVRNGRARGITPKGIDRLRRLRNPVRTWIGENWFPVIVAAITASIGIGSIIVNVVVQCGTSAE